MIGTSSLQGLVTEARDLECYRTLSYTLVLARYRYVVMF
jgi:hypothetical protein